MLSAPPRALTVEWEVVGDHRFASVRLGGGLVWRAWHSSSDATAWVDGRIEGPAGFVRTLDIVAIRGDRSRFDGCDFDVDAYSVAADAAWARGAVFFAEEMCIFAPFDGLGDNRLADAVARFFP